MTFLVRRAPQATSATRPHVLCYAHSAGGDAGDRQGDRGVSEQSGGPQLYAMIRELLHQHKAGLPKMLHQTARIGGEMQVGNRQQVDAARFQLGDAHQCVGYVAGCWHQMRRCLSALRRTCET